MKALILVFAVLGLVGCSQSTLMVTETGSVVKRFGWEVVAEANEKIEISRILSGTGKASKSWPKPQAGRLVARNAFALPSRQFSLQK